MCHLRTLLVAALITASAVALMRFASAPVRAVDGAGRCGLCHAHIELALDRGKHSPHDMTCVLCHGESEEHIAVEDNSIKPERPLRRAQDAMALCTQCHAALAAHCEEPPAIAQGERVARVARQPVRARGPEITGSKLPVPPGPAPCARCHDPHRATFWAAETAGKGPRKMSETFQAGTAKAWSWREGDDWAVVEEDGGNRVFALRSLGTHGEKPRRPVSFALWKGASFSDFVLTCRVRCTDDVKRSGRSLIIVFDYTDYKHFYYVHLCNFSDAVHNNLLIVNEEDRKPLLPGGKAKPTLTDGAWHRVKIVRRASDGLIEVYYDDMDTPLHRAFDKTHTWGLIGVGTFHSKGDFDDVMVEGELRLPAPTSTQ